MRLLVGAPVLLREWIIERHVEAVNVSAERAGVDVEFVYLVSRDDPTWDVLQRLALTNNITLVELTDETRTTADREWLPARLERIAELRNRLLAYVREHEPGYFLSLDSDILAHPDLLANLLESITSGKYDVVGGYCFLSTPPNRKNPSYAQTPNPHCLHRPQLTGVIRCDVVMAIVMMSPPAFEVPYSYQVHGEDIGWSIAARAAGLRLGVDARVTSKHVIHPRLIDVVDPRCGY